jgi:hypothetical protein
MSNSLARMFDDDDIYRDTQGSYAFRGKELNTVASLLRVKTPKSSIDLANEMSRVSGDRTKRRAWTEQAVYAAMRQIKPRIRGTEWFLVSGFEGYTITRSRELAEKRAERWVKHGKTMIANAKDSVK